MRSILSVERYSKTEVPMKTHGLFDWRIHRVRMVAALASLAFALPAQATFHFMQIEQVIGGVNGDTTAQAVQLRMRFAGQNYRRWS